MRRLPHQSKDLYSKTIIIVDCISLQLRCRHVYTSWSITVYPLSISYRVDFWRKKVNACCSTKSCPQDRERISRPDMRVRIWLKQYTRSTNQIYLFDLFAHYNADANYSWSPFRLDSETTGWLDQLLSLSTWHNFECCDISWHAHSFHTPDSGSANSPTISLQSPGGYRSIRSCHR